MCNAKAAGEYQARAPLPDICRSLNICMDEGDLTTLMAWAAARCVLLLRCICTQPSQFRCYRELPPDENDPAAQDTKYKNTAADSNDQNFHKIAGGVDCAGGIVFQIFLTPFNLQIRRLLIFCSKQNPHLATLSRKNQ